MSAAIFVDKHKLQSEVNRSKATGIHSDSLDIYIKAARRIKLSDANGLKQATILAQFFSRIVNGEIPQQFKTFIRQTYLVALEKDPEDKTKLRPHSVSHQPFEESQQY